MEKKRLIFVTGGARSGKSTFAEKYAESIAEEVRSELFYLATAKQSDEEMIDRIRRHQKDRKISGAKWKTIECPIKLVSKVNSLSPNSIVLLDCLTILLSNELFQHRTSEVDWNSEAIQSAVIAEIIEGIDAILHQVNTLIIVSNEVFYSPVTEKETLTQVYRKVLGLLHQQIVEKSTEAYAVESGIALLMKESS